MLTLGVSVQAQCGFWWLREARRAWRLCLEASRQLERFLAGLRGCLLGALLPPSGWAPLHLPTPLVVCHLLRQLGPVGAAGASLTLWAHNPKPPPAAGPLYGGPEASCGC